jgi:hypothetical protein
MLRSIINDGASINRIWNNESKQNADKLNDTAKNAAKNQLKKEEQWWKD